MDKKIAEQMARDRTHEAKKYLKHYFQLLADNCGVRWDSDNDAEIETAVDMIIEAAEFTRKAAA